MVITRVESGSRVLGVPGSRVPSLSRRALGEGWGRGLLRGLEDLAHGGGAQDQQHRSDVVHLKS